MSAVELTAIDGVLRTLSELSQEDRRWIIERLSPEARARLATSTGNADGNDLNTFNVSAVLEALHSEPAWVVQGVLSAMPLARRKEALHRLSPTLRIEVARLDRSGVVLAPAARRFLLDTLLQRLSQVVGYPAARQRTSVFESLVSRFGSKDLP